MIKLISTPFKIMIPLLLRKYNYSIQKHNGTIISAVAHSHTYENSGVLRLFDNNKNEIACHSEVTGFTLQENVLTLEEENKILKERNEYYLGRIRELRNEIVKNKDAHSLEISNKKSAFIAEEFRKQKFGSLIFLIQQTVSKKIGFFERKRVLDKIRQDVESMNVTYNERYHSALD